MTQPDNPVAVAGHNAPPAATPFEIVRDKILLLYQQAADYLDGDPIATQGQADDIGNLKSLIRAAEKEAETLRKDEVKPFDDGKAEVQARYNPLIADTKSVKGKTVLAIDVCNKALAPWLKKQAEEQEAAAKAAREEADRQRKAAEDAIRAANADNLAAREAAEELARQAKDAERAANAAAKARPKAGSMGRAAHLRTYHDAFVSDRRAFARWCWEHDTTAMDEYLARRAQELTDAGQRSIPGVNVVDRKEVA